MPLVSMRQLLDEAARGGYGVGAFNVNNMEQIQAIMEAARETKSPVIIQASRGARSYSQDRFLYHLMLAATELYPEIPTVLHLDHGNSVETCKSAIAMGFTSVMMDGSLMPDGKTPSNFEYNVSATREVVELAHAKGVTVEGEIGCLGGIEDGHGAGLDGLSHLTDPDQAVEFVRHLDLAGEPGIRLDVLGEVQHRLLHGRGRAGLAAPGLVHIDVAGGAGAGAAAVGVDPGNVVLHGALHDGEAVLDVHHVLGAVEFDVSDLGHQLPVRR